MLQKYKECEQLVQCFKITSTKKYSAFTILIIPGEVIICLHMHIFNIDSLTLFSTGQRRKFKKFFKPHNNIKGTVSGDGG
jgi:hypothetical protein